MDMCGVPNPGYVVRDLSLPAALWDGRGAPPPTLSAEDRAFWREHAYGDNGPRVSAVAIDAAGRTARRQARQA